MGTRTTPFVARVLIATGLLLSSLCPQASAQDDEDDEVAERQSVDAFISIEDGQPGGPGSWELAIDLGWQDVRGEGSEEDIFEAAYELKYTGAGSDFRKNTKLSLVQAAELGNGKVDGNGDVELNWQQRWRAESNGMPTLGTLLSLRLPAGRGSTGTDITLTGILDKDAGPGTVYFSASGTFPIDVEDYAVRDFIWGARFGYKWRVADRLAVYGNYVFEISEERGKKESNILEFATQYEVNEHLILGPGILVGLDNHDGTPDFGAGIKFTIGF